MSTEVGVGAISVQAAGVLYRAVWTCGCCGRDGRTSQPAFTRSKASLGAEQSLAQHREACLVGRDALGIYGRLAARLAAERTKSAALREPAPGIPRQLPSEIVVPPVAAVFADGGRFPDAGVPAAG
jgi:hypothetical protein